MLQVVITMAGEGRRFREAGYDGPKYSVRAHGKSLLWWSLKSLLSFHDAQFWFATLRNHGARDLIEHETTAHGFANFQVLELDQPTDGQAATVAAVAAALPVAEPLLIYNIDTYVDPAALQPSMIRGDGWLPAFRADGAHWSFVRAEEGGRVVEVAEKRRISDLATIGLYYFSSVGLFSTALLRCTYAGYKERFVAPLYQELIVGDAKVFTDILPPNAVHCLGTPAELDRFIASYSPSA